MVKKGDKITIHYKGRLENGAIFDSSEGRDPLAFTVGSGMVIKGFDEGVKNMTVGEKKTIHIPCAEAYGEAREDMILDFPKDQLPADMQVEIGMQLQMNSPEGDVMPVTITAINESSITLDANHTLAGKDLIFDLELMSIN